MRINKKLGLVIFLILQIICISLLKNHPEFIERFYSNGLYVFLSKLMRYTFGWIPFSMGDVLYTLSGLYAIRWLFLNRKRMIKDTKNWLLDIGAVLSIAYFAFHALWGFNYYRQPLNKSLEIKAKYTTEELIGFTEQLIAKSNQVHELLAENDSTKVTIPFTRSEAFDKIKAGYDALSVTYPHLYYQPHSIKKSIYSTALTYMGFSGYLNPFTNEAQVNGLVPTYKYPTTACHEAAHQLGYAAENEANFIGCLAAIKNDDLYFKYSGYSFALRYCLAELYRRDGKVYSKQIKMVNKGILKNFQEVQDFWEAYENPLEPVFEKTFDQFLKVNNQSEGMKSYSYVVALLVNYYSNTPL